MAMTVRVGIVEDHSLVAIGMRELLQAEGIEAFVARTVDELLGLDVPLRLAILDLRLADGSGVTENITRLHRAGLPVLILTAAENVTLVREAARCGVLGVVRKSLPEQQIREAVLSALDGQEITSLEWAAALDSDPDLPAAGLTSRERDVLALYASGEPAARVANLLHLTPKSVYNHIARIRQKYADAGRPAKTRVDLYQRAREDRLLDGSR